MGVVWPNHKALQATGVGTKIWPGSVVWIPREKGLPTQMELEGSLKP